MSLVCEGYDEVGFTIHSMHVSMDRIIEAVSLAMVLVAPLSGLRYSACTKLSIANDEHRPSQQVQLPTSRRSTSPMEGARIRCRKWI